MTVQLEDLYLPKIFTP